MRDKVEDQQSEGMLKQEGKEGGQQLARQPPLPSTASPPSASSSPTHEFSFTISLHQPSITLPDKTKAPPSTALDLSPADEIFFHGHLLPLHLLSHLPAPSPRSSTNSLDSFTLPKRELLEDQNPKNNNTSERKERPKLKSFSTFFRLSRRRKGFEVAENEEKEQNKKKLRFDLSHVLKSYMRMVRPLLSFRGRRRENTKLRKQPYSFSGSLSPKGTQELRGRRGEFSAPASMRTSPTDSGLLLATGSSVPTSTSDSTMEELQAAIQAAIAHCKNSIAMEDKIKG